MAKNIWPAIFLLLTLDFCHFQSPLEEAKKMARAYAACSERYGRLEGELDAKLKSTPPGRYRDKVVSAFARIKTEKKAELEKLLQLHEKRTGSDELDLLRSKILIEIGRFGEAERIIDRLNLPRADLALEARLQKVIIHLSLGRSSEAQALLKKIEAHIKKDSQFYNLCLALAFSSPDAKVREEYAQQFVAAPDLPAALQNRKADMYANLATLANDERRPEKARDYLEKALALSSDPQAQDELRFALTRTALIGKPAPSLQADSWFNSAPVTLAGLKGKVVAIHFWAPWCAPCRELLPVLLDEQRMFADQGLRIIGYTKLYGGYNDGSLNRPHAGAAEEIALIKKYVQQSGTPWPEALGMEGLSFDTYSVTSVPTLVMIDRRGNVAYIKTGSSAGWNLRDQIRSLITEK